jgi:hypothetical protein
MRQGLDRNLLKILIVLAPFLLILMSFSGCIQTQLFRDVFFEEDQGKTEWEVTQVLDMYYEFTGSALVIPYSDQQNFEVKDQALWLIISVETDFHILYPNNVRDWLNIDDEKPRFVKLIITDPDGTITIHTFENSVTVNLDPILDPKPGLWRVRVEAEGRGFAFGDNKYYDEFSVTGRLNQPKD